MLQYPCNAVEYYYIAGAEVTREEYVDMMLRKIGKEIFAKYYYDFRRLDFEVYSLINENYTEKSKKRRTSLAISLIRQGLAEDALLNIASAKKIDPVIARLARSIYSCEFHKELGI